MILYIGVREDRSRDTKFKRWTAELFYKFQGLLWGDKKSIFKPMAGLIRTYF